MLKDFSSFFQALGFFADRQSSEATGWEMKLLQICLTSSWALNITSWARRSWGLEEGRCTLSIRFQSIVEQTRRGTSPPLNRHVLEKHGKTSENNQWDCVEGKHTVHIKKQAKVKVYHASQSSRQSGSGLNPRLSHEMPVWLERLLTGSAPLLQSGDNNP